MSQSSFPQPYWKQSDKPQALQSRRGQANRDEVYGHWPSGEDDDDLDNDQNDAATLTGPQPQTAAETTPKEDAKKPEHGFVVKDSEPAKNDTHNDAKPKEDVLKPADAMKKKCE